MYRNLITCRDLISRISYSALYFGILIIPPMLVLISLINVFNIGCDRVTGPCRLDTGAVSCAMERRGRWNSGTVEVVGLLFVVGEGWVWCCRDGGEAPRALFRLCL